MRQEFSEEDEKGLPSIGGEVRESVRALKRYNLIPSIKVLGSIGLLLVSSWSLWQLNQMQQILQDEQDKLNAFSQQADARWQVVAGKVHSDQSSVQDEQKTLQEQVKKINVQLSALEDKQKQLVSQQSEQVKNTTQLTTQMQQQIAKAAQRDEKLNNLQVQREAIQTIQQDILLLRADLDKVIAGSSKVEFDGFRAQVSRSLNALQQQMQSLQAQLKKKLPPAKVPVTP